jgi:hypothetical protein
MPKLMDRGKSQSASETGADVSNRAEGKFKDLRQRIKRVKGKDVK